MKSTLIMIYVNDEGIACFTKLSKEGQKMLNSGDFDEKKEGSWWGKWSKEMNIDEIIDEIVEIVKDMAKKISKKGGN